MRRTLLRDTAQSVRERGVTLEQFKAEVAKSLQYKMGSRCTRPVLKTAMKTIEEVWGQKNCSTCIRNGVIRDPEKGCPECNGRGYTYLGNIGL